MRPPDNVQSPVPTWQVGNGAKTITKTGNPNNKPTAHKAQGSKRLPVQFNFVTANTDDWAPPAVSMGRVFEAVELDHARRDLQRRIAIATLKQEYGLLTCEEQDRLINEGDLLKRAIKNWSTR
jgi:hypothetical protein